MGKTVYFMPPYVISEPEMDMLVARTLKIIESLT
jgi:adenosylmethionine-8-amino-7-oxononanoate aminotransferase